MRRVFPLACALLAGCYDLDKLLVGETGIRIAAQDVVASAPHASIDLRLLDSAASDLQVLAFTSATSGGAPVVPLELTGWSFLRESMTCSLMSTVLFWRISRGAEDERVSFDVEASSADTSALAVGFRGVDPALPLGPVDYSNPSSGAQIAISAALRPEQRWFGIGISRYNTTGFVLPGLPERAGTGTLSLLFGIPEVGDMGALTYSLSGGASSCDGLFVAALLPR